MRKAIVAAALVLGGCGGAAVPPSALTKPASRCMAAPEPIPEPMLGEQSVSYSGRLIDHIKAETSKELCLQKWARTVTE